MIKPIVRRAAAGRSSLGAARARRRRRQQSGDAVAAAERARRSRDSGRSGVEAKVAWHARQQVRTARWTESNPSGCPPTGLDSTSPTTTGCGTSERCCVIDRAFGRVGGPAPRHAVAPNTCPSGHDARLARNSRESSSQSRATSSRTHVLRPHSRCALRQPVSQRSQRYDRTVGTP